MTKYGFRAAAQTEIGRAQIACENLMNRSEENRNDLESIRKAMIKLYDLVVEATAEIK